MSSMSALKAIVELGHLSGRRVQHRIADDANLARGAYHARQA